MPVLRIYSNIVVGNDIQTNEVIINGGLEKIFHLLDHKKKDVIRESLWILSNITAGNAE